MKPLNKGFEASEKTVSVKIEGEYYEVANLRKSGLLIQSKVIIAICDKWHQVNVIDLGADDSNLENFKSHVELYNYKLKDFGINVVKKETQTKTKLEHNDFMRLEEKFPTFSYIKIAKLYDYCHKNSQHYSHSVLCEDLKRLTQRNQTVEQYIGWLESQKNEIINNSKPNFLKMKTAEEIKQRTEQREFQLYKAGILSSELGADYVGNGFTITQTSIETDSEEAWLELMGRITGTPAPVVLTENQEIEAVLENQETTETASDEKQYIQDRMVQLTEMGFETTDGSVYTHPITEATIPFESITDMDFPQWHDLIIFVSSQSQTSEPEVHQAQPITEAAAATPETPAKKPVSLEVIGTLAPSRITELMELSALQDQVLLENPLIEVKDAESLKKAKASVSALLKASTNIDGTKGIKVNKNRFLKQLSTTIDAFLDPLAKKTRDRYDKLKARVDVYENAEVLKKQEEQKQKVLKINNRTKALFDVPMVFNGELYTIGNLHILPSQIETLNDEDFEKLLFEANEIKSAIDAEANKPDPMVLAAAEMVAAATNRSVEEVLAEMKTKAAMSTTISQPDAPVQNTVPETKNEIKAETTKAAAPASASTTTAPNTTEQPAKIVWQPETTYTLPDENNKMLSALDLEHSHALEHPGYIKCRSYYKRGTKDVAAQIRTIFASDHPKKSDAIKELLEVIEKS